MAQKVRITTYMKNVAKSFGYALGDTMSEYNPVVKSILKDTKETASDMYDSIKSFAFEKQSVDEKSFKGQAQDAINDAWNNFKDDLKSGNWYNKERQNAANDDLAKAMGFDMDFDFDEDWGDFDDSDSSTTQAVVESGDKNARQVITAVDVVGSKVATSVSNATAESASYIVNSNNKASRALYGLNQRGFASINQGLAAVNGTIASFAQISAPLSTHMQNSALFYTNTTKVLSEMNQSVQQIVKNTTPAPLASQGKTTSVRGTFSSIFDDSVGISIDSYKEMVKENFKDSKDMLDWALDAVKSIKTSNSGSMGKNVSLMQLATTQMTKVFMPKIFKESMKSFNDSLKYAISGGMMKMRDKSGGLAFEILKEFFLPKDGYKSTINVGNYNKGAVSWDGMARKALTEVIPTTLLKIYSAITGEAEMRYDYNTGKFIKISSIKKQVLEQKQRYAKDAGGDFRTGVLNGIEKDQKLNDAQKAQLSKEIENYFYTAFTKGSGFTDINKNNFKASDFGLSEDSLKLLQQFIADDRNKKGNKHMKFVSDVQRQRDSYGDYMRREEATGSNIETYLNNGFVGSSKGGQGTDEYNHSMSFYLQGIYQYTGFLADNIKYIAGKSRKIVDRKGIAKGGSIASIATGTDSQSAVTGGERTRADANTNNQNTSEIPFLDEDQQRSKEHEENMKNAKKEAKNKVDSIGEKIRGFFAKDNPKGLIALYNKPFEAAALLLDKVGLSLDKLIWGEGDDAEGGIFGFLIKKTKESFTKFTDWLDDKFGIKDKWNKAKDWAFGSKDENGERHGGAFGDFRDQTVNTVKGMGSSMGNTVKQFFGKRKVVRRDDSVPTAAYGKKVTKSGIVAVSEGELIVPSELNPFYHGATNKSHQRNNEKRIASNFLGSFADGGEPIPDDDSGGESLKDRARKTKERLLNKYKFQEEGAGRKFVREGFETLGEGASRLFNGLFGNNDEDTSKKDNKIIKTVMQKLMKEAGDSKGAMGAGALIGAGVSVATGAVVGPLFGAAIGSAVGLVANSKTVQKILFGADEETGEVNGGLFSKNISKFMMKNVPSMAKGGALGGVAGAIMGSPVIGAVAGAAIGYVSSSEKAKAYLFGKDDGKGGWKEGLIPKSLQDKIKKATPNIAAGVIAGAAIGPFGLVGNMIVGAGLGYLTTSEKFHNYMFGDGKDDKGLVGLFKEKIFDNLDGIFHNMGNAIAGWGKNLIRSTDERIKDFFTKKARAYENGEQQGLIGKLIGGATSLTGKAVKGATNLTGNILGGVNSRLQAHNLSKGYGVYDREQKRNMYASERMDARGGKAKGTFGNFDQILSNAGSMEELQQLQSQLEDVKDPSRMFKRSRNTAMNQLYDALQDMDPKKATKIAKLVQKGDSKALANISSLLTDEEKSKYLPAINEALGSMTKAKNSKSDSKAVLKKLKDQGINLNNQGDLNNALDQIKYEMGNGKFSPEEQAKNEEKDWRTRVLDIFKSMDINIAAMSGGKAADKDSTKAAEDVNKDNDKSGEETPKTSIKDFLNGLNDSTNGDPDTKTEFDMMGNPIQYVKNNQGEWIKDTRDNETKESSGRMEKLVSGLESLPLVGTGIAGLHGLFSKFSDKLLGGDGEKKKGLFSSLLDFLGGEDGPLKSITNLLFNNPIGQSIKNIAGNATLGTILSGVVAPALLIGGFSGKFDDLGSTLSDKIAALKGNDTAPTLADNTSATIDGQVLATDKDGNYIKNDNGEYQTTSGQYVSGNMKKQGSDTRVSTQLKKNLVNGAILGTGSVATQVVKGAGNAWKKMLGKGTEAAAENPGLVSGIMGQLAKLLEKIPVIIGKIPFLPAAVKDNADTIVTAIYTHLDDAVKAAGPKLTAIASKLANVLVALKIAYIAGKGIDAWGNAESILGITQDATTGQRIIAVLISVLNALIPVIGDLIPNKVLVNIFMQIAPKIGIDVSSLQEQRDAAEQEVAQYNEKNGTDLSIEEYNQMNGKAGVITKAKNWGKSLVSNIKEQGIGKTLANTGTAIKEGAGKAVNVVKDGFVGAAKKANEITGFTEILGFMKQGDVKGLLSYTPATEDDSTGMSILKTIPTIPIKYSTLVPTMFVALGKKISSTFKDLIAKVKGIANIAEEERNYGAQLLADPDSHLKDFFVIKDEDPENPMGGFAKAFRIVNRVTAIPVAILKKIGKNIKETFDNTVAKVKNSFNTLVTNETSIVSHVLKGDPAGLWNMTMQEDEDNPVGGFTHAIFNISRFMHMPDAALSWVGHKIKDGFDATVAKAKNSFTTLASNYNQVSSYTKSGSVSELLSMTMKEDEENPVGGITNGIFNVMKFMNVPSAAIHWVGAKIKKVFDDTVTKTKSNQEAMSTAIDAIKGYADDGDLKSIWSQKFEPQDGDPLKFVWTAGFGINRLFQSAVAVFNKILGPIKDAIDKAGGFIGDVKDIVDEKVDNVKEKVSSAATTAKNWVADKADSAFQAVKGWVGGDSGLPAQKGTSNGFVSQFDSKYKDMKLGASTVSEKGCGPAVATMLSNDYGAGISMNQAIKAAAGYQDKDGTKASYFSDLLGRSGITTNSLPGKNIPEEVMESLRQGNEVILLGKDAKNTSKNKSPFGPNNHYVIASGLDKNGNIIIKDPESNGPRVYSASILNNAMAGIDTNGSGGDGSAKDTDIAKKVWGYFTSQGYSPAATAGIMGNLYQESGMDPTRFQNGGPAAGIAQWENYTKKSSRWAALNSFAQSIGMQWSDLDPQLQFINQELSTKDSAQRFTGSIGSSSLSKAGATPTTFEQFKQSTDPMMATRQFEGVFERAGKPAMDNRLKATEEYYKLYHDSSYTGNYTADASAGAIDDGANSASIGGEDSSSSNGGGIASILGAIGTAFSTAFGKIFGTGDSSSTDTTGSVGGTIGSDGSMSSDGITSDVATDAVTGPGNDKQKALAEKLLGIQGKLTYSMSGARNPDKGSADCSSTVNWAYKKVTGQDIGNSTPAILSNGNTEIIDMASNMDKSSGGDKSSGPNVSKLMPGDILLYSRPSSSYSAGRPYRVGHVEMYAGNNKRIGHGGGMGPKVTDISKDANRFIMAKRLKGITGSTTEAAAAGSGLLTTNNYDDIARMSGGSSGLLLSARPGTKINGKINAITIPSRKSKSPKQISGGDSGMVAQTTSMLNNLKTSVTESGKSGAISADLVEKLLNSIIKVLETISNNTSSVDKIYQVLSAYTKTTASASTATAAATTAAASKESKSSSQDNEIDSNIKNLVGTLAAIAMG